MFAARKVKHAHVINSRKAEKLKACRWDKIFWVNRSEIDYRVTHLNFDESSSDDAAQLQVSHVS